MSSLPRRHQTVFGKGLARSEVMLVGEQPGDKEDVEGEPFVGPAAVFSMRPSLRRESIGTAPTLRTW